MASAATCLELLPRRIEDICSMATFGLMPTPTCFAASRASLPRPRPGGCEDVHVTFVYGDVGGMWLQTATEAAADVRILGPYDHGFARREI